MIRTINSPWWISGIRIRFSLLCPRFRMFPADVFSFFPCYFSRYRPKFRIKKWTTAYLRVNACAAELFLQRIIELEMWTRRFFEMCEKLRNSRRILICFSIGPIKEEVTGNSFLNPAEMSDLYSSDIAFSGCHAIKFRPYLILVVPLLALRIFVIAVITISRALSQVCEGRARGTTISVSERIQYHEVVKLRYYRCGT